MGLAIYESEPGESLEENYVHWIKTTYECTRSLFLCSVSREIFLVPSALENAHRKKKREAKLKTRINTLHFAHCYCFDYFKSATEVKLSISIFLHFRAQ